MWRYYFLGLARANHPPDPHQAACAPQVMTPYQAICVSAKSQPYVADLVQIVGWIVDRWPGSACTPEAETATAEEPAA